MTSHALHTLGALAAGFGLAGTATAQVTPAAPASAPAATLPAVRAQVTAEPEGRDAYQAGSSTAGSLVPAAR